MRVVCEVETIDVQKAHDQSRIRRQLERILEHSSFRNSKRYHSFLRYVVEERLNGNAAYLKERLIGVAVFKQPLDYDTNANSVVRVTAGEVRRRLAQYYLNATAADEVLIELPLGSYVPEFRNQDVIAPPETALNPPTVGLLYDAEELRDQPIPLTLELVDLSKGPLLNTTRFILIVGCCLLVSLIAIVIRSRGLKDNEADLIWKGAFDGRDVLLCAGPLGGEKQLLGSQDQGSQVQFTNSGISLTTAKTVSLIGSAIGRTGGNAFLLPMQDTKLEDLQRSPTVLVGAFNNGWTMRLQAPLRYQFAYDAQGRFGIVDTKEVTSKRFMGDDQPTRDYGLLAHFHSPTTGQSTVIVGGLGMHGTAAVRIFLSSPELIKEFSKSAPRGWEKSNYEIVLASDLVNNLADSPKVVAVYFW